MPFSPACGALRRQWTARPSGTIYAAALLVACMGTVTADDPQELPLLSTEIQLVDHGIESPESIVRGEISIEWAEDGPRLGVSRLRDARPVAFPVDVASAAPPMGASGCFDIDEVSLAGINALGGRFGAYNLGGAGASAAVRSDQDGRRVIAFQCDRGAGPDSSCGLWMQLFDADDPVRTYLNASGGASLAMWMSRQPPATELVLKVADAAWSRRDDALPVGSVNQFASEAVSGAWDLLTVPLAALPGTLARDSLATLVLEATGPSHVEILVGGVQLCEAGGRPKPLRGPPSTARPEDAGSKALWVWNTRQLLDEAAARSDLLDYIEERGFDRVFLQLVPAPGQRPDRGFVPFDGPAVGALIAELRQRGTLTYAMDGDPNYALEENHAGVFSTIRAVAEHNRNSPLEERFHGVHYDVEPYLLPGFHGLRHETLLDGFVQVVGGISRIARAEGLEVGVAVPFWLDAPDRYTGEALTAEFDGKTAGVLEHLTLLVDELAIMDYRTTAAGSNGGIALILDELEAARRAGIGIWVGVETAPLMDADAVDFSGSPQRGLPTIDGRWIVVEPLGGGKARFWFVPEGGLDRLRGTLESSGAEMTSLLSWAAGAPIHIAADSQSYFRLGADRMETEVGLMLTELTGHPAFLGMAYHHYESLRALEQARDR